MSDLAGSASLAANPAVGDTPPAGEPGTIAAAPEAPWYETAGIDPKYHEGIKAKGWDSPNALAESYVNVEKLVSMERGGDVDRILVRPKDDATPEEIAAFRAKAGFAAPASAEDYGFTPEQIAQAPVLGEAAKWFQAAGVPKDVAGKLMEQIMPYEQAQIDAFRAQSDTDYRTLATQMGDAFGDFEESGRRAFRQSGLDPEQLNAIERGIGTKAMLEMFGKFGKAMSEADAPQPGRGGGTQFTQSAQGAKDRIAVLQKDSDFQAKLLSTNPEVRKSAQAEWEGLFKRAYPEA